MHEKVLYDFLVIKVTLLYILHFDVIIIKILYKNFFISFFFEYYRLPIKYKNFRSFSFLNF